MRRLARILHPPVSAAPKTSPGPPLQTGRELRSGDFSPNKACLHPPQVLAGGSDQRARTRPKSRPGSPCIAPLPVPAAPFFGYPPPPLPAPLRGRLSPPSGAPALCQVPGDPCPREGPVPGHSEAEPLILRGHPHAPPAQVSPPFPRRRGRIRRDERPTHQSPERSHLSVSRRAAE